MELLTILLFTLTIAKTFSISCDFCVQKNLTYYILEDWDKICSKSVEGRKVRLRLITVHQCRRADRFLKLRRGSVTENVTTVTASTSSSTRPNTETSTVIMANVTSTMVSIVTSTTTTTTWATPVKTTAIPELSSTFSTETPMVSTITTSSSSKKTQNYSVTSAPLTTVTIPSLPDFRNSTVTPLSLVSSLKTIMTTPPTKSTSTQSTVIPPSSLSSTKLIITTLPAKSVYAESTVTPSSTSKVHDNNLYDRMWSSVIRSYTLLNKVDRLYHNLTKPLRHLMESSPVYQLVNNKGSVTHL